MDPDGPFEGVCIECSTSAKLPRRPPSRCWDCSHDWWPGLGPEEYADFLLKPVVAEALRRRWAPATDLSGATVGFPSVVLTPDGLTRLVIPAARTWRCVVVRDEDRTVLAARGEGPDDERVEAFLDWAASIAAAMDDPDLVPEETLVMDLFDALLVAEFVEDLGGYLGPWRWTVGTNLLGMEEGPG